MNRPTTTGPSQDKARQDPARIDRELRSVPHDEHVIAVETADGHHFQLIEIGDREAADMVLIIPGMGIPARHYIGFARALERRGHRVLIHEWRGIGSSDQRAARDRDWGYPELIELDLVAAVAAARSSAPGARLWLAGHSLGGQMACIVAGHAAESAGPGSLPSTPGIVGVAVIASGAPYARAYSGRMRWILHLIFRVFPALSVLVGYFPGRRVGWGGNEARGVMSDWAWTGRKGRYDLPSLSFDAEAALNAIELPVLVLRMADDTWVTEGSVAWLLGKMPAAGVRRRTIDRDRHGRPADHFNWLHAPEASAAEVHDWIIDAGQ